MTEVKTSEGVIECPDLEDIGPRTKYWAGVIRDVIRTEEMYMVMGAALEEAYRAGVVGGLARFMEGLGKMEEVIDVEATPVEAAAEECEAAGPEPEESALPDPGSVSAGPTATAKELPGSVPEGSGSERGDQEKVEA